MKCILDKCPIYYNSGTRASCDITFFCDKDTDCPVESQIKNLKKDLKNLERLRDIIKTTNKASITDKI
jgi:hypothetical protein